jgi:Rrf2 family protein
MKLSQASRYAVQAVGYLAGRGEGPPVPSHLIAQACGLPEGFLLKVLKPLVDARLLRSLKGPHGGYALARPAAKVTLLEVVEAVDGPIRGQAPLAQDNVKGRGDLDRRLEEVCERVAEAVRKNLGKVRLSELAVKV